MDNKKLSEKIMYNLTTEKIKELEKKVNDFFTDKGIAIRINENFLNLSKKLGFNVYLMDLPEGYDGIILLKNSQKVIGISNKVSVDNRKYVITHELAHYIDEYQKNNCNENNLYFGAKDTLFHNDKKRPSEDDMDYMSAAMLVPMNKFINYKRTLGIKNYYNLDDTRNIPISKIDILSSLFNVSNEMIYRRIYEASLYEKQH